MTSKLFAQPSFSFMLEWYKKMKPSSSKKKKKYDDDPTIETFVMDEREEDDDDDDDFVHFVVKTDYILVPFSSIEPQEILSEHCVRRIKIDDFYGEFQLLGSNGTILGQSKNGVLSLLKKDIQNETTRLVHNLMCENSENYRCLSSHYGVGDPGMDFKFIKPTKIQFLDAPKSAERIPHIKVQLKVSCICDLKNFTFITKCKTCPSEYHKKK